jgi:hypothetical protein
VGSLLATTHLWVVAVCALLAASLTIVVVVAIALRGTNPADRPAILKAIAELIRAARPAGPDRRSGH